MTFPQALFLGALQGVSELFPVSSLAQTILLPALLKWDLKQERPDFLAFVVVLHLATAIALLIYFWKDWRVVIAAFVGSAQRKKLIYDEASKFAWLLVAGTVVVGAVGLVFEKKLRVLFENPRYAWVVAAVLVVNGIFMLSADYIKRQASKAEDPNDPHTSDPATDAPSQRRRAEDLTMIEGASIGATQSLALIPGISRSGVTMVAGLLAGLSYEQATRFAFMLATPVIGLAALKKIPSLLKPESQGLLKMTIPAALVAGIFAYFSTHFLMRYFKHNRLSPFGWYCIIFGLFALVMLKH